MVYENVVSGRIARVRPPGARVLVERLGHKEKESGGVKVACVAHIVGEDVTEKGTVDHWMFLLLLLSPWILLRSPTMSHYSEQDHGQEKC